jgi:hypothetical protein
LSASAVTWALTADTGGHSATLALVTLAHAESDGAASLGRQALADQLHTSTRQVSRYLEALVKRGLIEETQRGNQWRPSVFLLMTPDVTSTGVAHDTTMAPATGADDTQAAPAESADDIAMALAPNPRLPHTPSSPAPPPVEVLPLPTSSLPGWLDILRQDERWKEPRNGWVKHTEEAFKGVPILDEAIAAIEWLSQDIPKARNIKSVTLFFTNWLKRRKNEPQPQIQGRRRSNAPATDEEIEAAVGRFT